MVENKWVLVVVVVAVLGPRVKGGVTCGQKEKAPGTEVPTGRHRRLNGCGPIEAAGAGPLLADERRNYTATATRPR